MRMTSAFLSSVLFLIAVAGTIPVYAAEPQETILYPGSGFDSVRIGRPVPTRGAPLPEGVKIVPGPPLKSGVRSVGKTVGRIEVVSPRFVLDRSRLRVTGSNLRDIRRYYGEGQTTYGDNVVIVRFPSEGVEFTVGRSDERIRSIAVFQPLGKRDPADKYRRDQDQFKQFKQFKY